MRPGEGATFVRVQLVAQLLLLHTRSRAATLRCVPGWRTCLRACMLGNAPVRVMPCFAARCVCLQAYGAGAYKRVGVVLQRALLVCWSVCLPICLMWLASHQLLLQLGQEPEIAALASRCGACMRCARQTRQLLLSAAVACSSGKVLRLRALPLAAARRGCMPRQRTRAHTTLPVLLAQLCLSCRYLMLCIPCLFLTTTLECLRKYLQVSSGQLQAQQAAALQLHARAGQLAGAAGCLLG